MKIKSIKKIEYTGDVYNLHIEDNHNYFANNICVSNCHKAKSLSFTKKILKATEKKAYYRWGMSGSFPADDTNDMMEIMAKTGPVVYKVKAKDLMDAGFITKVKIKCLHLRHQNYNFTELLEIVSNRDKKTMYDLECAKIQLRDDRLAFINDVVNECNSTTLVLFHNTEYGEKMFEYLKTNTKDPDREFYFIDGSVNNKKRNNIKIALADTSNVKILVASFGTLSTGISIPSITNVIFTQSFKKEQVIIQSIGRALRLHQDKKMAYIFDIVDIFDHDPMAYRHTRKFTNKLLEHGNARKKIYDNEEYPYKILTFNLPEYDDPEVETWN